MRCVTESGLYSLILTSRKPAARRFRKWVTAEVLPALRRTGRYTMPGAGAPAGEEPSAGGASSLRRRPLAERVEAVKTYAGLFGRAAGRVLWVELGLPHPAAPHAAPPPPPAPHPVTPAPVTPSPVTPGAAGGAGAAGRPDVGGPSLLAVLAAAELAPGLSVAAALHAAADGDAAAAARLREAGLALDPLRHPGYVAIANRHPRLAEILGATWWGTHGWRAALRTVPGAAVSPTRAYCGRVRSRATLVPLAALAAARR